MFGKVSDRSRGPQWPSATRAESAIRRPRRSQTGLEQWIAESIALGYPERPAWRLRSGDLDRRVGGLTRRAGETPRFGKVLTAAEDRNGSPPLEPNPRFGGHAGHRPAWSSGLPRALPSATRKGRPGAVDCREHSYHHTIRPWVQCQIAQTDRIHVGHILLAIQHPQWCIQCHDARE